jgi:hypothetical protein
VILGLHARTQASSSGDVHGVEVVMSVDPIERLLRAGFMRVGAWQLEGDGIVVPEVLQRAPAVYAFAVDGQIQYIGSASGHLPRRMRNYARPGKLPTAGRLNGFIREHLVLGRRVEIFAAFPTPGAWNDLPVDMILGLEAGLIREFHPP